jgi:hypothetical protein
MSNLNPKWSIAINPFLAAIKGSYVTAKRISNFLTGKLSANSADPDIAQLYNDYLPTDTAMNTTYTNFIAQGGTQSGASEGFNQKLSEITAQANLWDAMIQPIYAKNSASYIALLPHGHAPFLHGAQLSKLTAVEALSKSLFIASTNDSSNATALNTIKATVDTYYAELKTAFDNKNEGKNISSLQSDACFDASIAVCEQQFKIYGLLAAKYYKTPELIAGYFDEANIRNHQQTDFTHTIKPEHTYTIAKRTFQPSDEIRINNTGNVALRFYAAATKDAAIGTTFIEILPSVNADYNVALLGDITNNHYLMVNNPDAIQAGSFVSSLL